ncbi:MAG TPA: inositol monophosphatase [Chloroflexi bacterium]|nr:inositol monophosphatase [Chloroflexota bacterium]
MAIHTISKFIEIIGYFAREIVYFYVTEVKPSQNLSMMSFAELKNNRAILRPMEPLNFAIQLAQQTGDLLCNYYQRSGIHAQLKADRTVVTEADLAADELLRSRITAAYPDDGILSEEAGTVYPVGKSAVWIIDPLDGTTNFSLGLHYWGISIARFVEGFPTLGVLYFPLLDELFTATKWGGAHLNGARLKVQPPNPAQPTSFFSCCSRANRFYEVDIRYKTRILGSAAYSLITVARGSAVLAFEVTPKVWDFSASWIITEEAGGLIEPFSGENPYPLVPGADYGVKSYPLLTAATPELLAEGRSKIRRRAS